LDAMSHSDVEIEQSVFLCVSRNDHIEEGQYDIRSSYQIFWLNLNTHRITINCGATEM